MISRRNVTIDRRTCRSGLEVSEWCPLNRHDVVFRQEKKHVKIVNLKSYWEDKVTKEDTEG